MATIHPVVFVFYIFKMDEGQVFVANLIAKHGSFNNLFDVNYLELNAILEENFSLRWVC